ncbi:hypothetical protein [Martelella sp. HB161492]|uniref:hypothetical protein n=1 Tax=Martelella sp. HB161492 TaxID=2720726 RepID=UPI0015921476|nr:hypothetical protein [Martelella sp. HB161492]
MKGMFVVPSRSLSRFAAVLVFPALVACSTTKQAEPEAKPAETVTAGVNLTALARICPPVMLDDDHAFIRVYSPASSTKPDDLVYQVSLGAYIRSCDVAAQGEALSPNIAVQGRIVGGPKAKAGTINVPIHVVMKDSKTTFYDQVVTQPVDLPADTLTTQFIFKKTDLILPPTAGPLARIYVGVGK